MPHFHFHRLLPGLLLVATVQAQIEVTYTAPASSPGLENPGGIALPDGEAVRLGSFVMGFDPVASLALGDYQALQSNWLEFDATVTETIDGALGRFAVVGAENDASFANRTIYLWVLQTPGSALPAADLSNVTALGLFSSSSPAWVFAEPDPVFGSFQIIITSDVDEALAGTVGVNSLLLESINVLDPLESLPEAAAQTEVLQDRWLETEAMGIVYRAASEPTWFRGLFTDWFNFVTVEQSSVEGYWFYMPPLGLLWSREDIYPHAYGPYEDSAVSARWIYLGDRKAEEGLYYDFDAGGWFPISGGW